MGPGAAGRPEPVVTKATYRSRPAGHAPAADREPDDRQHEAGDDPDRIPGADHRLPEMRGEGQLVHPVAAG